MVKKILFPASAFVILFAAFFAFAQDSLPTTPPYQINAAFDPTCIQNAIEKRDAAIILAFDKFASSIKAALEARKTALKDAFAKTDKKERRAAIKKVWNDWKIALKNNRANLTKEKKAAWQQFKTDQKSCKGIDALAEDGTKEGVDAQL